MGALLRQFQMLLLDILLVFLQLYLKGYLTLDAEISRHSATTA